MSHSSFREEHRIEPKHPDDVEVPAASNAMEPNPGDETPRGERRGRFGAKVPPAHLEQIVGAWPETPRETARRLIEDYGPPQEFSESRLVWYHADGKRTVLSHGQAP